MESEKQIKKDVEDFVKALRECIKGIAEPIVVNQKFNSLFIDLCFKIDEETAGEEMINCDYDVLMKKLRG